MIHTNYNKLMVVLIIFNVQLLCVSFKIISIDDFKTLGNGLNLLYNCSKKY